MKFFVLVLLICFVVCQVDEILIGYGVVDKIWVLCSIDGVIYLVSVILMFFVEGLVSGKVFCNSFLVEQILFYLWFLFVGLCVICVVCVDFDQEQIFFIVLGGMIFVEIVGDVLILFNDKGGEMVFIG